MILPLSAFAYLNVLNHQHSDKYPLILGNQGDINRDCHPDPNRKSGSGLEDALDAWGLSGSRRQVHPHPDLDPTRLDFCQDTIPLQISCPYLITG